MGLDSFCKKRENILFFSLTFPCVILGFSSSSYSFTSSSDKHYLHRFGSKSSNNLQTHVQTQQTERKYRTQPYPSDGKHRFNRTCLNRRQSVCSQRIECLHHVYVLPVKQYIVQNINKYINKKIFAVSTKILNLPR